MSVKLEVRQSEAQNGRSGSERPPRDQYLSGRRVAAAAATAVAVRRLGPKRRQDAVLPSMSPSDPVAQW